MDSLTETGYLKISNIEDRNKVAAILYANGYNVSPCRVKKNGKSFEYLIKFRLSNPDDEAGGLKYES